MACDSLLRRAPVLSAVAVAIAAACGPALAQDRSADQPAPDASKCTVPADIARFDQPLSHVSFRLSGGLPIKIVAIGSSSTLGFGASSPANAYPGQLEAELHKHFPGHPITVVNRGVNGEEIPNMLARFGTAVIAERPHLVIWQIGTNSLLYDWPLDMRRLIAQGVARLRAIGADVVLMDPQYAPRVLAKPGRGAVLASIARAAREHGVGLLRRYDVMRHWREVEGLPYETFVMWDGLHMNDWGYACLAKSVGVAIAEAASRPTSTAAVPRTAR